MFAPGHLGELTAQVPFEMVDAVVAQARGVQRRVRRLPARVVVYLLMAGALFEGLGWSQVWARLTAGLADVGPAPSRSSICAAMRRVGVGPVRALFDLLKGPAASMSRAARFAGLLVVAIDGTVLSVADSVENLKVYSKRSGGPNGDAGYPGMRLVALVACGTRTVIDAVFGPTSTGETTYAARLVGALRPGKLLLGDRSFPATDLMAAVAATGAHFLMRVKTGNRSVRLPIIGRYADGSYESRLGALRVRVIDATITISTTTGAQTGLYRLITTLTDPRSHTAPALLRLYHQRWEIETAYCELKSTILGGRVLRGRTPQAVEQETWALLTTYQVLRTAMTDATNTNREADPDRASFTIALHTARDQLIQAAGTIAQTTIDLVGKIGTAVLAALLPTRQPRTRPRVVKRAISKYRAKARNIDQRTYKATLEYEILTQTLTPSHGP